MSPEDRVALRIGQLVIQNETMQARLEELAKANMHLQEMLKPDENGPSPPQPE